MFKAVQNVFKVDGDCAVVPLEPRKDVGNEIAVIACGDFTAYKEGFIKVNVEERILKLWR